MTTRRRIILLPLGVLFLLLAATPRGQGTAAPATTPAPAAAPRSGGFGIMGKSEAPIDIVSERFESDNAKQVSIFIGHVVAIQGPATLTCDRLEIYYVPREAKKTDAAPASRARPVPAKAPAPAQAKASAPGSGPLGGNNRIQKIVARGNVVMTQEDKRAIGKEATYYEDTRTIVLVGDPEGWQGQDHLAGKKVVYYVDEDRTVVEGGGDKVHATLFPKHNVQPAAPAPATKAAPQQPPPPEPGPTGDSSF